jgi:hypothetical protein
VSPRATSYVVVRIKTFITARNQNLVMQPIAILLTKVYWTMIKLYRIKQQQYELKEKNSCVLQTENTVALLTGGSGLVSDTNLSETSQYIIKFL